MSLRHTLAAACLWATLLLSTSSAAAATGMITGRIEHWNALEESCDRSVRNCTGAKFTDDQLGWRPVRHVKVYARNAAGTILGSGTTNLLGDFNFSWTATPAPARIHVTWHAQNKDGRVNVLSASGGQPYFWTFDVPTVVGGTTTMGTLRWGTSAAPHDITNVYEGAHRFWWDSWYWATRLKGSAFFNVGVLAGAPCPSVGGNCADADDNRVYLVNLYSPQAFIGHELGHLAYEYAHENQQVWEMTEYCYPNAGSNCGWDETSAEWHNPGMDEATASFLGAAAYYYASAPQPMEGNLNLEASAGTAPRSGCLAFGPEPTRQYVHRLRLLWDLYDSVWDNVEGLTETTAASMDQMTYAIRRFPNGRSNHQKNEGWECFLFEELGSCWMANRDARNMFDYTHHYEMETGNASTGAALINCH